MSDLNTKSRRESKVRYGSPLLYIVLTRSRALPLQLAHTFTLDPSSFSQPRVPVRSVCPKSLHIFPLLNSDVQATVVTRSPSSPLARSSTYHLSLFTGLCSLPLSYEPRYHHNVLTMVLSPWPSASSISSILQNVTLSLLSIPSHLHLA